MTGTGTGIELVALDIDGTLLTSVKTIAPRTRAAVHEAARRGVHVALVTGRRHPSARLVADDLGLHVPLILHNGALIVEDGAVIECRPLPRETAQRVIELGRREQADPVVHWGSAGEGLLFVEGGMNAHESLARYLGGSRDGVRVVDDLTTGFTGDPVQVMFGGALRPMADLFAKIGETLGTSVSATRTVYPHLGCAFIDVLRPGVSKGEALLSLCGRYGLRRENVLAIGDNWNDVEMLHAAGRGLVMGTAEPELLSAGFEVLPGSDADGVAVALERYVLV
jgi:5-amino-6-(5-phospho-D-ribitylamino)uracil phosphatase